MEEQNTAQYDKSMRPYEPVISAMRAMGYGLMLDGKTFYKLGYELDPYLSNIFNMHQACDVHAATQAAAQRVRVEELEWVLNDAVGYADEQCDLDEVTAHGARYVEEKVQERLAELTEPGEKK
jgi:hypothetical protein